MSERRGSSTHKGTKPLRLRSRTYHLKERLGTHGEKYRAIERQAGGRTTEHLIIALPRSSEERLRLLERINQKSDGVLPRIEDSGHIGDTLYVVLPWVPGRTLREYLDTSQDRGPAQRIAAQEAIKLFRGFAHGLSFLNHRANIVHGDIKPENLVVHQHARRLVLIDFGSAWLVERTVARTPGDGYTPHYVAPELQDTNAPADFRSDQFSATAVLFEMLTGEIPYQGIGGQIGSQRFGPTYATFSPPSKLASAGSNLTSSTWNKIDAFTRRGLAIKPADRYPNRKQWLDAIDEIHDEVRRRPKKDPLTSLVTRLDDSLSNAKRRLRNWLTQD